jgi:hypothetical protein
MSTYRIAVFLGCFFVTLVSADEGMWQPAQLPDIADQLRQAGLESDPEYLADLTGYPMGAVIGLGFCSAAFVSPKGLALTNHHCAHGAIQYNSTPENNLLENGFVARALDQELPAQPNMRIYVTTEMSDVTATVNTAAGSLSGKQRYDAIETAEKALVRECEQAQGYRCRVDSFFGGYRYQLIKRLEIKDVRLVYAPRRDIGKFGGDVDNWMWPRHTGDFSFFRAYVAPDGSPAPYDRNNVPFRPEHHLRVDANGLGDGDFAMVIGYPGRTNRYRLALEVEDAISWSYPKRIALFESLLAVIAESTGEDEEAALRYESLVAGLNNALKNNRGMLDGFARDNVVERKQAAEQELRNWLQSDQTLSGEYLDELEQLEREIVLIRSTRDRDFYYGMTRWAAKLLATASTLYRLSQEQLKPDSDREPGYQERDLPRIKGQLEQLDRQFHPRVDQALMANGIRQYTSVMASNRVAAFDRAIGLVGDDPDLSGVVVRLQAIYDVTRLGELEVRLAWMNRTPDEFRASDDPMIQLAVALYESDLQLEAEEKAREGRLQALRSRYMEARLTHRAASGGAIYDDANNSLRVTYGQVRGYSPRDGVNYGAFTSLAGILEKHTGEWPFDATSRQLELITNQDFGSYADPNTGSVPVNFLTTVDITGGNSGSPTLNARGELVGLAFDGNYESMNSSWAFNRELTRAIHVDIRYLLWVMDRVDGAGELVAEMGLTAGRSHSTQLSNSPAPKADTTSAN